MGTQFFEITFCYFTRAKTARVMRRVITHNNIRCNILPTTRSDSGWHADTYIWAYVARRHVSGAACHVYNNNNNNNARVFYNAQYCYTSYVPPPPRWFTLDDTLDEILILWPPETAIGVGGWGEAGTHIGPNAAVFHCPRENPLSKSIPSFPSAINFI